MTQLVRFRLDDAAVACLADLRAQAATAGCSVPSERRAIHRPEGLRVKPAMKSFLTIAER